MKFAIKSMVLGGLLTSGLQCAVAASNNVEMVTISNYQFVPAILVVKPGTTVMWTNADTVSHNVTATDGSWKSGAISSGSSFRHLFKTSGTFEYTCTYHPSMHGKVVVTASTPAS